MICLGNEVADRDRTSEKRKVGSSTLPLAPHQEVFTFQWGLFSRLPLTFCWRGCGCRRVVRDLCSSSNFLFVRGFPGVLPLPVVRSWVAVVRVRGGSCRVKAARRRAW
jgi:hypothetical protein